MTDSPNQGGFLPPSAIPPTPSSLASNHAHLLPRTRTKPLLSGSAKEAQLRQHLDEHITTIQRKHAMRGNAFADHRGRYRSFSEVAHDVEELIELVWISATR